MKNWDNERFKFWTQVSVECSVFRIPVFDWGAEFFLDPLLDSIFCRKKDLEPRSFYTLVGVSARDVLNPSMDSSLFSSSSQS